MYLLKRKRERVTEGVKLYGSILHCSCIVATDIGKKIFLLLDKRFPKTHKFYKIFNRNNVKVSYSLLPNISSIIKSHNKKVLSNNKSKSSKSSWNCRDKSSCPLNCNCSQQNVVYCGKVILRNQYTNKNHPHYIGLTECSFKDRLYKHKNSFKYENKRNATELPNFIWDQKSKNMDVSLVWSILDKAKPYSPGSRNCMLSLTEKYHILFLELNLLNKRNELVSKCIHEHKYYLSNYKSVPPE